MCTPRPASRQCGDERLAFTGLHFRDFAVVQHHAADQLHVEMAHVEEAAAGFADQRKGRHNGGLKCPAHGFLIDVFAGGVARVQIFEGFLDLVFQRKKACLQLIVTEGFDFCLALVDGDYQRLQFFDVALVLGANKSRDYAVRYLRYVHERACRFPTVSDSGTGAR